MITTKKKNAQGHEYEIVKTDDGKRLKTTWVPSNIDPWTKVPIVEVLPDLKVLPGGGEG